MNESLTYADPIEQLDGLLHQLKAFSAGTTAEVCRLTDQVLTVSDTPDRRIMKRAAKCIVDYERASVSLAELIKSLKKIRRNMRRSVAVRPVTFAS